MNIYFNHYDEAYSELHAIITKYQEDQQFWYVSNKLDSRNKVINIENCYTSYASGFLLIQNPNLTFYISLVTKNQVKDNQALLLPIVFDRQLDCLLVIPVNPYTTYIPIFNQGIDDDSLNKRAYEFNSEMEEKGYRIIAVWEESINEITAIDDPSSINKQTNDEFFRVPEMELAYLLTNLNTSDLHRSSKIGIKKIHYSSSKLARLWKEDLISKINNCCILSYSIKAKCIEKIEQLYRQITGKGIPTGYKHEGEFILDMCSKYDNKDLLHKLDCDDGTINVYKYDHDLLREWLNGLLIDLNEDDITKEKQQFCKHKIEEALVSVKLLEIEKS